MSNLCIRGHSNELKINKKYKIKRHYSSSYVADKSKTRKLVRPKMI